MNNKNKKLELEPLPIAQIVFVEFTEDNPTDRDVYLSFNGYTAGYSATLREKKQLDAINPDKEELTEAEKQELASALHYYIKNPDGKFLRFEFEMYGGLKEIDPNTDKNAPKLDWIQFNKEKFIEVDGAEQVLSYSLFKENGIYRIRKTVLMKDFTGDISIEKPATEKERELFDKTLCYQIEQLFSILDIHDMFSQAGGIDIFTEKDGELKEIDNVSKETLIKAGVKDQAGEQAFMEQYYKEKGLENVFYLPSNTQLIPGAFMEKVMLQREKTLEDGTVFRYKELKIEPGNFNSALSNAEISLNCAFNKIISETEEIEKKLAPIRQNELVKPDNLLMIKSALFKNITEFENEDFNEKGIAQKILKYNVGKNEVETTLSIQRPIEEKLDEILLFPIDTNVFKPLMRETLNMYDGKVFKGICTLIDAYITNNPGMINRGLTVDIPLTLNDIHKAMGYSNRLSKAEAERLKNSIVKLTTTLIHYDWKQEQKARHIAINEAIDLYGNSVMYTKDVSYMIEGELSNNIAPKYSKKTDENGEPIGVEGVIIKAIPPIYAHAKLTGVISSVPVEWFNVEALGNMSDRRNSLLQGLTEKIKTAQYFQEKGKNPNESNYNVIVLDNFFYQSGIEIKNKQTKAKLIKDLETILKDFKDRGIIKKFTYGHKNRGLHSIKFFI